MKNDIIIIDYGMGNLGSIQNMIKKIGYTSTISRDPGLIKNANKVIFPGVGSFDHAMEKLKTCQLIDSLQECKKSGCHILGICLGMQIMTKGSEEGDLKGLGWIDAQVIKFSFKTNALKVPHMGWNIVEPVKNSPIFKGFRGDIRAYFVHSYHVECNQKNDLLATTPYGIEFVSLYQHDNIFGMQFHPEKSHKFGMKLLQNFIEI